MSNDVLEKTFTCGANAVLKLSNIRGKVGIQAGGEGEIKIRAEKILDSGDAENTIIELAQDVEGRVIARTRYSQSGFGFFQPIVPCRVNYDVHVPRNCDLQIRGVSNNANIKGISGNMDVSSVSGNLKLTELSGAIKIKSVSGDTSGEQLRGPMRIETVSGDFILKKCDLSALNANSVSGDLILETSLGEGSYEFNAVSGDIKLELIQLIGITVDSTSLSGDLRSSLPLSVSNHSRNHQRIEVKGGGVVIHHKSVSGDFYLSSAEGLEDSSELPSPISGHVENISHTKVLDDIARGDLSVDEAVGILEKTSLS